MPGRIQTRLESEPPMFVVTFYAFAELNDLQRLKQSIECACEPEGIVGTVLLATEGLNATLSSPCRDTLEFAIRNLQSILSAPGLQPNWSTADSDTAVFDKLVVKIRDEIVTFGREFDFSGIPSPHVDSATWAALIQDERATILDIRNEYEIRLGRFRGSISPQIQSFKEFEPWLQSERSIPRDQTTAIYCTGGIRCEKAVQVMRNHGFKDVVQLNRGVLGYFDSDADKELWEGECFVFDKRVAVRPDLTQGTATQCFGCRRALTKEDRESPDYVPGVSCQHCRNRLTEARLDGLRERVRQVELARQRNQSHLGKPQTHLRNNSKDAQTLESQPQNVEG